MKRALLVSVVASTIWVTGCSQFQSEDTSKTALETTDQQVSYLIGRNMAEQFKRNDVEVDIDAFSLALRDVAEGTEPRLDEEQTQAAMKAFQEQQIAKQQEKLNQLAEKNKQEGEAFLADNKTKEGVIETASGLQYKIITEGSGAKPKADDTVTVHYRGTLLDGTQFDSSYDRGEPVTFPLDGVIPGWTEGLQLLKEGTKAELYIPSDLAYGPGGTQGPIGPNATLIFEVELLKVGK